MRVCLILGNGFSISLLSHLKRLDDIDIRNLFSHGAELAWPATQEPGFLSFRHCPNLWHLGARPNLPTPQAVELIEDIITTTNVFASMPPAKRLRSSASPTDIYINAYHELIQYLRHLFVHYDNKLTLKKELVNSWCWSVFLRKAYRNTNIKQIDVITYNYDVWLERILALNKIPFDLPTFKAAKSKVRIYKPHGSISFIHKDESPRDSFRIPSGRDEFRDAQASEYNIRYDNLDANHLVPALIPPAGDASRMNRGWSTEIRSEAARVVGTLTGQDQILICGLSYWHVDRSELDQLLVACSHQAVVRLLNPSPSRVMVAVLSSLFDNFILHPSQDILHEVCK